MVNFSNTKKRICGRIPIDLSPLPFLFFVSVGPPPLSSCVGGGGWVAARANGIKGKERKVRWGKWKRRKREREEK